MKRPIPKELVVQIGNIEYRSLDIYCATPDAAAWIDKEAPTFGTYINFDGSRLAFIDPNYDLYEVVAYLEQGYVGCLALLLFVYHIGYDTV